MKVVDLESMLEVMKLLREKFQVIGQQCRKSEELSDKDKDLIEQITIESKLLVSNCNSLRYATNRNAKIITLNSIRSGDWLNSDSKSDNSDVKIEKSKDICDVSDSDSDSGDSKNIESRKRNTTSNTKSTESPIESGNSTKAIIAPYKAAKKHSQVHRKYMMKQYCQQLDTLKNIKFPAFSDDSWLGCAISCIHKWYKVRFTSKFKNYKVDNIPLWVLKILCSFAYDEVMSQSYSRSTYEFMQWFDILQSDNSTSQDIYSLPATCHSKFLSINCVPKLVVDKLVEGIEKLKSKGFTLLDDVDCVNQWFNPQSVAI